MKRILARRGPVIIMCGRWIGVGHCPLIFFLVCVVGVSVVNSCTIGPNVNVRHCRCVGFSFVNSLVALRPFLSLKCLQTDVLSLFEENVI